MQNTTRKRSLVNSSEPEIKEEKTVLEEDDVDPLDFIEIKSAAQWKAMSKRISWNFDHSKSTSPTKAVQDSAKVEIEGPPTVISRSPSVTPSKRRNCEAVQFTVKPPIHEPLCSNVSDFKLTKVTQLRLICWKIKPWNKPKSNKLFSSQFAIQWNVDCDEVYPGLFVGDKASASNVTFLKKHGITHILNTAEGKEEGLVDLSQEYFKDSEIKYMGFPLWDCPNCNILPYLGPASEYINDAIANGGKCLVNCQMGVSRSSTCAMAYLMVYQHMKAVEVLTQFRQNRDVRPNDGFLEIIVKLDNDLRLQREDDAYESNIKLARTCDLHKLPRAWNYEFWVNESLANEDEIGMPLVRLGEPCPIRPFQSHFGSFAPSRTLSRNTSLRRRQKSRSSSRISSKKNSFRSSRGSSLSRHESLVHRTPSICVTPPPKDQEDDEEEWEWFWEDEKAADDEVAKVMNSPLTTKKLEKVKDIIEKPEERWRILWNKARSSIDETPSPVGSIKSMNSNTSNLSNCPKPSKLIQPGVEGDVLSMVKVVSAKQWKNISEKVTINFDDINIVHQQTEEYLAPNTRLTDDRPATPCEFIPTLVKQLRLLCWRIKPWDQPKDRYLFTSVLASGWGVDCDEVFPNIFIGDEASARNIQFLKKMGITHVLNTAEGIWTDHSFVDLTPNYYRGSGITYQGFTLWDSTKVKISPYFGCANEFISNALTSGGKCLVHCQMGVSRSCICAMTYMMLTLKWKAVDTLREFRKRRDVRPNDHFLAQICDLDNELRKFREHNIPMMTSLKTLADVPKMPKPYHREFWDIQPDSDELPFVLLDYPQELNGDKPVMSENSKILLTKSPRISPCKSPLIQLEIPQFQKLDLPLINLDVSKSPINTNLNLKVPKSPSINRSSIVSSDSEWEYYYSSSEEQDKEEEKNNNILDFKVGCAAEWKTICQKNVDIKIEPEPQIEDDDDDLSTFIPTTDKQLRLICWKTKPWKEKKNTKMFSSQFAVLWNVDCDEVYPNLFIGDAASACNVKFLHHLGIKNVLNTAEGVGEGLVDLNHEYFTASGINYLGLHMWDNEWFDISPFIDRAVEFIREAMESGGKCLVNCQMGVSRSSTCAMSYMMKIQGWTAVETLKQFRSHRDVRPNDGFMKFLVNLDNTLRKQRLIL